MILIDTADSSQLAVMSEFPFVRGLTCNPAMVAKHVGRDRLTATEYEAALDEICHVPGDYGLPAGTVFMVQLAGPEESWERQAKIIESAVLAWGGEPWFKVLPTVPGLRAATRMRDRPAKVLVTAVFSPRQVAAASSVAADGIAVYLRRLLHAGDGGRDRLRAIIDGTRLHGLLGLVAGIPDIAHLEIALAVTPDVTVPPSLVPEFLADVDTAEAAASFEDILPSG